MIKMAAKMMTTVMLKLIHVVFSLKTTPPCLQVGQIHICQVYI